MDLEENIFPWIKKVKKEILISFPEVNEKTLCKLLDYIHQELEILDWNDLHRAEILYNTLRYFSCHFLCKVKWHEVLNLEQSCVQLLYYMTYVGLILSKGNASPYLSKVLLSLNFFADNSDAMYDVLLLIRNFPSKYLPAYEKILKSVLRNVNIRDPVDVESFLKILLLFRRLKSLTKVAKNGKKEDVYSLASKLKCPGGTLSFLSAVDDYDECSFTKKNIVKKFLNKSLNGTFIKNLIQKLLRNKYHIIERNSANEGKQKADSATKSKLKMKERQNIAKEEEVMVESLKKSKKNKKEQKSQARNEFLQSKLSKSVGKFNQISFAEEQHKESKIISINSQNCENASSEKLRGKKRKYSTCSDSNSTVSRKVENMCSTNSSILDEDENDHVSKRIASISEELQTNCKLKTISLPLTCSDKSPASSQVFTHDSKINSNSISDSNLLVQNVNLYINCNKFLIPSLPLTCNGKSPASGQVFTHDNKMRMFNSNNINDSNLFAQINDACRIEIQDKSDVNIAQASNESDPADTSQNILRNNVNNNINSNSFDKHVSNDIFKLNKHQSSVPLDVEIHENIQDAVINSPTCVDDISKKTGLSPNSKKTKRKIKSKKQNLSKELISHSFSDSGEEENTFSSELKCNSDFNCAETKEISVEPRTKDSNLNSKLFSKYLPLDNLSEDSNKIKKIKDKENQTFQENVNIFSETKIHSLSNKDSPNSNKGRLGSQSKGVISTTFNGSDKLTILEHKTMNGLTHDFKVESISSLKTQSEDLHHSKTVDLSSNKSPEESMTESNDIKRKKTKHKKMQKCKENLKNSLYNKTNKELLNKKIIKSREYISESDSNSSDHDLSTLINKAIKTLNNSIHDVESANSSDECVSKTASLSEVVNSFSRSSSDSEKRQLEKPIVIIDPSLSNKNSPNSNKGRLGSQSKDVSSTTFNKSDKLTIPKYKTINGLTDDFKVESTSSLKTQSEDLHHSKTVDLSSNKSPEKGVTESDDIKRKKEKHRKMQKGKEKFKNNLQNKNNKGLHNEKIKQSRKYLSESNSDSDDYVLTTSINKANKYKTMNDLTDDFKIENISSLKTRSKDVHHNKTVELSSDKSLEKSMTKSDDIKRKKTKHRKMQKGKEKFKNSLHNKNNKGLHNEKIKKSRNYLSESNSDSDDYDLSTSINKAIKTLNDSIHDAESANPSDKCPSKTTSLSEVVVDKILNDSVHDAESSNPSDKCLSKTASLSEVVINSKSSLESEKKQLKKPIVIIEPISEVSSDSCYELNESSYISKESELKSDSSDDLNDSNHGAVKTLFNSSDKNKSQKAYVSKADDSVSLKYSTDCTKQEEGEVFHRRQKDCDFSQKKKNNCVNSKDNFANESVENKNSNSSDKNQSQKAHLSKADDSVSLKYSTDCTEQEEGEVFHRSQKDCDFSQEKKNNSINSKDNFGNESVENKNSNSGKKKFRQKLIFEFLSKSNKSVQNNNKECVSKNSQIIDNRNPAVVIEPLDSTAKIPSDILQTQTQIANSASSSNSSELSVFQSNECTNNKQEKLKQFQNSSPVSSKYSNQSSNVNNKENANLNNLQDILVFSESNGSVCNSFPLNQDVNNNYDKISISSDSSSKNVINSRGRKVYKKKRTKSSAKSSPSDKDSADTKTVSQKSTLKDLDNSSQKYFNDSENTNQELNFEIYDTHQHNCELQKASGDSHHILNDNIPILTKQVRVVLQDCRTLINIPKAQNDVIINGNECTLPISFDLNFDLNFDQSKLLNPLLSDSMPHQTDYRSDSSSSFKSVTSKSNYDNSEEHSNHRPPIKNGSSSNSDCLGEMNQLDNSNDKGVKFDKSGNLSKSADIMFHESNSNKVNQLASNDPDNLNNLLSEKNYKSSSQPFLPIHIHNSVSFVNTSTPIKESNVTELNEIKENYHNDVVETESVRSPLKNNLADLTQSCQNTPELLSDESPLKLGLSRKTKRITSESDLSDNAVLKFSSRFPKKSRKLIFTSESDVDDHLKSCKDSEKSMDQSFTQYRSDNSSSFKSITSKSNYDSSEENSTNKISKDDSQYINPKSFIVFSASEAEPDYESSPESELDDFIVPDHTSEDQSEQELNKSYSSLNLQCSSEDSSDEPNKNSSKKLKKVVSESEYDSPDVKSPIIKIQRKKSWREIYSESDGDDVSNLNVSDTTSLTEVKKVKTENFKRKRTSKFKKGIPLDHNSNTKKIVTENSNSENIEAVKTSVTSSCNISDNQPTITSSCNISDNQPTITSSCNISDNQPAITSSCNISDNQPILAKPKNSFDCMYPDDDFKSPIKHNIKNDNSSGTEHSLINNAEKSESGKAIHPEYISVDATGSKRRKRKLRKKTPIPSSEKPYFLRNKKPGNLKHTPLIILSDHSESASSSNITQKRKAVSRVNNNKKRNATFANNEHNELKHRKQVQRNSVQKFPSRRRTDSSDNVLSLSRINDKNSNENGVVSDSSECISPTPKQKNVLKISVPDSSEYAPSTQILKESPKNSQSDLSECIPPTEIQKISSRNSDSLILNYKNFNDSQEDSRTFSNENSSSLVKTSKFMKRNSSAANVSLSVNDDSQIELNNANLNISIEKNRNYEIPETSILSEQYDNLDKTQNTIRASYSTECSGLLENQLNFESAKGVLDLSLRKTRNITNNFLQNEPLYSSSLFDNNKNSNNFVDKETLTQEFLLDSCDDRLISSVMDKLQVDSSSLISASFLNDPFAGNTPEFPIEPNLSNIASGNQHMKSQPFHKDNNPLSEKCKESSLNFPAVVINKINNQSINSSNIISDSQMHQLLQKPNCDSIPSDKNSIMNTNCNVTVPQINSLNLGTPSDENSFVNANCIALSSQTNSSNLDLCIELIQSDKVNNSDNELQSNNSSLSLDQQLRQMGFEMVPDPKQSLNKNCISNYNQTQSVKCCSETVKPLKEQSSVPKTSEKFLFLFDVEKKSYEVCVLPEASLINIVNKPTVTHSESQTDINEASESLLSSSKNISKTKGKVTESIPENEIKLSKPPLLPVVNLGRRCDDVELILNDIEKIYEHSKSTLRKSERNSTRLSRQKK